MKRSHVTGTGRKKTWVKSSRALTLFLKDRVSRSTALDSESPWAGVAPGSLQSRLFSGAHGGPCDLTMFCSAEVPLISCPSHTLPRMLSYTFECSPSLVFFAKSCPWLRLSSWVTPWLAMWNNPLVPCLHPPWLSTVTLLTDCTLFYFIACVPFDEATFLGPGCSLLCGPNTVLPSVYWLA